MEEHITVTISLAEYERLLKCSETLEIIQALIDSDYVTKSDIKVLVKE